MISPLALFLVFLFSRDVLCTLGGNYRYNVYSTNGIITVTSDAKRNMPILVCSIDVSQQSLTVYKTQNKVDYTENKLSMRDMMLALWRETGGADEDLLSIVKYEEVYNEPTRRLVAYLRAARGMSPTDGRGMVILNDDSAWDQVLQSPFGLVTDKLAGQIGKYIESVTITSWGGKDNLEFMLRGY